jgi:hypothetical protein
MRSETIAGAVGQWPNSAFGRPPAPNITPIQEKNPTSAIDLPRFRQLLERTFIHFMLRRNIRM